MQRESAENGFRYPKANLLLVSIDTLRADPLGCYGSDLGLTPNLDQLAKEGATFLYATSAANHTAPSHATMLTGMSPDVHGVVNSFLNAPRMIPTLLPTLAERLSSVGFRTAADTDGGYLNRAFGFGRGFEQFHDGTTGIAPKVDRCLAFFDGIAAGSRGFFFLHTYDTHGPYRVSAAEAEEVFKRYPKSIIPDRYRALQNVPRNQFVNAVAGLLAHSEKFNAVDANCLHDLYLATIRNVDREIGRLVEGLRNRGHLERTVVVVTSDHGEEFGEHVGFQHESIFDEVMRVPLIMRFPDARFSGKKLAMSFGSVHLTPTILDVLGFVVQGMEGRSQKLAIETGMVDDNARVAFASHMNGEEIVGHAARTVEAKYMTTDAGTKQRARAFDLTTDPKEQHPFAVDALKGASTLAERLKTQLSVWRAFAKPFDGNVRRSELSEELIHNLRMLGYTR